MRGEVKVLRKTLSQGIYKNCHHGGHPTTFQNIPCIPKGGGIHPIGQDLRCSKRDHPLVAGPCCDQHSLTLIADRTLWHLNIFDVFDSDIISVPVSPVGGFAEL